VPDLEPAPSAVAVMSPAMTAVVARGISGRGCALVTVSLIVPWGAVISGIAWPVNTWLIRAGIKEAM
jgi:hypothetical protein